MQHSFLVFHADLLTCHKSITEKPIRIQICSIQPHTGDLAVFIGGVIVYAFCCVAAAGVDSFFVKLSDFYAALLLGNGTQNVKQLADAC